MNLTNEVQNFINLQSLLTEATKLIRKIFLSEWQVLQKCEWIDNADCGENFFIKGAGKNCLKKMFKDQREEIYINDSNKWDISFFNTIFQNSPFYQNPKLEQIQKIKDIRNKIAHNSEMPLSRNLNKQAANEPPMRKMGLQEIPNDGVAEAEHSLGIEYQEGAFVSKSLTEAVYWYERAIEHGSSYSANNLGIMYFQGNGVTMDIEKAEKYLLLSHKRGCNAATSGLVDLYITKRDPEKALLWHQRGMENKSMFDMRRNDEILKIIYKLKKQRNNLNDSIKSEINLEDNSLYSRETLEDFVAKKYPIFEKLEKLKLANNPSSIKKNSFDIVLLKEYADKGSITAMNLLMANLIFMEALFEFVENMNTKSFDFSQIIMKFAKAYEIDYLACLIPIHLKDNISNEIEKILKKKQTNDVDLAARICFMHINMSDYKGTIQFIDESMKKYPNVNKMYELRGSLYFFMDKHETAIKDFDFVLEKEPNNYELLYLKGAALRILDKSKEAIEIYEAFIKLAPYDHRKLPEAYYAIGTCQSNLNIEILKQDSLKFKAIIEDHLKKGEEAEKQQIPCFLPYDSNSKIVLENYLKIFSLKADIETPKKETITSKIANEKSNLTIIDNDPNRIELIKMHREFIFRQKIQLGMNSENERIYKNTTKPPKKQKLPQDISVLKKINLNEIDFTKDQILDGYIIHLWIIDVPAFLVSVQFVVEDEKKSVERLSIYNLVGNEQEISENFKIGTEFSIINPYIRLAADGKPMIRVDDSRTIVFSGRVIEKMCRYCGEANSKFNCAKCNKACYCSKECQIKDWKILGHKFICC